MNPHRKYTTEHYVYVLARPNGRVFYVGKGQGNRIMAHERKARGDCRCHKCNVIRKIWRDGGEVQRYTVFTTSDEQAAFAYERELIAFYGRKNLCNQTDGGEGAAVFGREVSEETREKLRVANKGRRPPPLTPEGRARISAASSRRKGQPGKPHTAESRAKISAAHKGRRPWSAGRKHSEETKAKMSRAHKGRAHPWHTGIPRSEETKAKMSASHRARYAECGTPNRKKYLLYSPDGVEHRTDDLAAFCRQHGLSVYSMRKVACGARAGCRGWRAVHLD